MMQSLTGQGKCQEFTLAIGQRIGHSRPRGEFLPPYPYHRVSRLRLAPYQARILPTVHKQSMHATNTPRKQNSA